MDTNAAGEEPSSRPKRAVYLSAKLRDTENAATPELRSHQHVKSHTVSLDTSFSPSDDESPPPSLPSSGHKRKRAPTPTDELEALQSELGGPPEYMKWTKANNFASILPKDRKFQKDESHTSRQSMLEPHLQPVAPKESIIPYTDDRFHEAAIQWLITTDQPISALQHPAFKNMINVAARATNGVRLPSRRVTSVVGYNRAGSLSQAHTCLHAREDDFVLEPPTN